VTTGTTSLTAKDGTDTQKSTTVVIKEKKRLTPRRPPNCARLPHHGLQVPWYFIMRTIGRPDFVPKHLSPKDKRYYAGLQEEFDTLGVDINRLADVICKEFLAKMVIIADNQSGTASKTWTMTLMANELKKTLRAHSVGYMELRDGTAFGTQILGIEYGQTPDFRQMLALQTAITAHGNLDGHFATSRYGVIGVSICSSRDGENLTAEETTEGITFLKNRVSFTFVDPGNAPTSAVNVAACKEADVHVLVTTPRLDAVINLDATIDELTARGITFDATNAFYMLNNWEEETPEQWRARLNVPDGMVLHGTKHDPGADTRKLSEGLGATFEDLQVDLKRYWFETRIDIRRAIRTSFQLRVEQLRTALEATTSGEGDPTSSEQHDEHDPNTPTSPATADDPHEGATS